MINLLKGFDMLTSKEFDLLSNMFWILIIMTDSCQPITVYEIEQ